MQIEIELEIELYIEMNFMDRVNRKDGGECNGTQGGGNLGQDHCLQTWIIKNVE